MPNKTQKTLAVSVRQINETEWLNKGERSNEQFRRVPKSETSLINRLNIHTDVAFSTLLPTLLLQRKLIRSVNFADEASTHTQNRMLTTENGKQSKQWHWLCYTAKLLLCQSVCRSSTLNVNGMQNLCSVWSYIWGFLDWIIDERHSKKIHLGVSIDLAATTNPHISIVFRSSFQFAIAVVDVVVVFFCNR